MLKNTAINVVHYLVLHYPNMKKNTLVIIFTAFTILSFGQSSFKKNVVFLEVGGNGLFSSLNYERQLTGHPGPGLRLGIGFYSVDPFRLTIPVGVNYLFRLNNDKSFFDVGFGVTYTEADVKLYVMVDNKDPDYVNTNYINFIPGIGYRRQTNNNIMWRVGFAPVINHNGFIPFFGFAAGKLF